MGTFDTEWMISISSKLENILITLYSFDPIFNLFFSYNPNDKFYKRQRERRVTCARVMFGSLQKFTVQTYSTSLL